MTTPMNPQEYKEVDEIIYRINNAIKIAVNEVEVNYMIIPNSEKRADEILEEEKAKILHLIEKAKVEAITNEIKLIQLFTAGRTYHEGTDWRHEVELYEQMLDNRLATLRNQTGEQE